MKTSRLCIVCTAVLLAGCDPSDQRPASPLEPQFSAGRIASATGSGHTFLAGAHRTFTLSAIQHADGSASGELQLRIHSGPFESRVHAQVVCLHVEGNQAWVGIRIERSTFPFLEEEGVRVADMGEGKDAPPDLISGGGVPGGEAYCAARPLTPLRPIVNGNIQVRG